MAYKKIEQYFSFADIAIQKNADKNRSLLFLRKVSNSIDWQSVETLLIKYYQTGKSKEGESQINDRISFKSFFNLPLDYASSDHSTFSRFRKRLSKEPMIQINSVLLNQFHQQGLSINKGIAVDARLVKSACRPISNKQIDTFKQEFNTPEGKLDKNGQPKNFIRDLDSPLGD